MASLVTRRLRPLNAHARLIAAALAVTAAALAWLLAFGSSVQWSASPPAPRPPHPMSRPGAAALSPQLARLASVRPAAPVRVIVQLAPGARLATARNLVRSLGGRPGVGLHIINALSAELSAGAAKRLASSSLIRAVSIDAA